MVMTTFSGCIEDDTTDDRFEYYGGESGNIVNKDGHWYYLEGQGMETRLNAKIDSITTIDNISTNPLQSGMKNILSITATGNGVLVLPQHIFPVIDGKLQNRSIVQFQDSTDLEIMVAPDLNESNSQSSCIILAYGNEKSSFPFAIEEGDEPVVSGQFWYDLEVLVTDDVEGYNGRYVGQGSPQLERAASYFRSLFESFGLEAEIQRYPASGDNSEMVVNVVAYKWGMDRDNWIVLGGHFDVAPPPSSMGTWEGAYDNTAGTCAVISQAKGWSQFETNKTIVFCLWSSEEEGLHGSSAFVDNLPSGVTVNAYINHDMIGLAYPSPGKTFHGWAFPDDDEELKEQSHFLWYMNHTIHDVLGLPRDPELFLIEEGGRTTSDHRSFFSQGIPSVYYSGRPVSHYHDIYDDLEHLTEDAGGVDLLIAGFTTSLWITFFTIMFLDNDGFIHPQ